MDDFRNMTNECIRIGLEWHGKTGHTPSMKRLCALSYPLLKRFGGYSRYRLNAISMAAGILSARAKSLARGSLKGNLIFPNQSWSPAMASRSKVSVL